MENYRQKRLQQVVAGNIIELRKKKSILQKDLALALGISHKDFSFIENGYVDIQLSLLERIADVLKVAVDELLIPLKINKADERYFNDKARQIQLLAKDQQDIMLKLLELFNSKEAELSRG